MFRLISLSMAILAFIGISSADIPMGAASFGWPPPRLWDHAAETRGQCGTSEGPSERTNFTIHKGHVLLFTQARAWNLRLGISHYSHPEKGDHFKPLLRDVSIAEIDAGITCIPVPDAPASVRPGQLATLQLKYVSEYGSPDGDNKTFFSCADIIYVTPENVPFSLPCFNTTEPKDHGALQPSPSSKKIPKPVSISEIENLFNAFKKKKRIPKWAFPLAGIGAGLLGALAFVMLCKLLFGKRRDKSDKEAVRQETTETTEGAGGHRKNLLRLLRRA